MQIDPLFLATPFLAASLSVAPASAASSRASYAPDTPSDQVKTEFPEPDKPAGPPGYLGKKGTIALGLTFDIGPANTGLAQRPLGGGFHPTIDVFVLEGLSIGAAMGFEGSSFNSEHLYTYGGELRTGYALRFNDRLAIWPKLILSYSVGGVPLGSDPGASIGTLEDLRVGANLPLVFRLGGHMMVEVGPTVSTDLWRTVDGQAASRDNIVGMRGGLFGWF